MRKLKVVDVELLIRPFNEGDRDFIMSTWLHTYRNSSRCWHVAAKEYYWYEPRKMEYLLEVHDVAVLCYAANPDVTVGWACYKATSDGFILHYLLIKKDFQGMGLGKQFLTSLVEAELGSTDIENIPLVYTYSNKQGHDIRRRYQDSGRANWRFNPYVVDSLMSSVWKGLPDVK